MGGGTDDPTPPPPKSRPLPALSWAVRRAPRRRLVWSGLTRRPGGPGHPTPRCRRLRPPHRWGLFSWKLLQPPQRGPLVRLHPYASSGLGSRGPAGSLLPHVTRGRRQWSSCAQAQKYGQPSCKNIFVPGATVVKRRCVIILEANLRISQSSLQLCSEFC